MIENIKLLFDHKESKALVKALLNLKPESHIKFTFYSLPNNKIGY